MRELAEFSDLILAVSGVIIALSVVWAVTRFIAIDRAARANLQILQEREFHSGYERLREKVEAEIARLNHEITDTRSEFQRVNHLQVDAQDVQTNLIEQVESLSNTEFLQSLGVGDVVQDRRLVFVLTPFHPREKLTYSAILEAFSEFDARVLRGDESPESDILKHIVRLIAEARLIIANVSSRNPNVMYELGIAHALGKPVILISSSKENDLPFDLRNQTTLFYRSREDLVSKLRKEVAKRFFAA